MAELVPSPDVIAELNATIAALRKQLADRDAIVRERMANQAATMEVLQAMSASPGDPQPVFDLIARQAAKLCNAPTAAVATYDGTMIHLVSQSGFAAYAKLYETQFPRPVGTDFSMGRAVLSRRIDQVEDIASHPGHSFTEILGHWSVMAVPMLRDGEPLGAVTIGRPAMGPFADSQVALLQTFAEQPVIAITSAKTYRDLQERTVALARRNSEYGERIDHQSATIDVLKAMSGSPGDAQPVFDLITRRARELCSGVLVGLMEFDGELVHRRSGSANINPAAYAAFAALFPMRPARGSIACRAILEKRIIHICDANDEPDLLDQVRANGTRSILAIPLMRNDTVIGSIVLSALEPGGFAESQVELLNTFAEQAVIAITSAASFRALRERTGELSRSVRELQALEEVLRAVNSSLDLDTVLSTIISRAVQLSEADEGTIYEFDAIEEVFVPKAASGMTTERVDALRDRRIRIGETPLGHSAAMRGRCIFPISRRRLRSTVCAS
jgi:GAF domain-containing protein